MTGLAQILREEIAARGPIPFHRFMQAALYHPEHGYYRGARDPFGKDGDFYTAEQLQPVFGILVRELVRGLRAELGDPPDFQVVELGAGRGEMAEALSEFRYTPVDLGAELPRRFTGVVFANEFFDALPVHVAVRRAGAYREMLVDWAGDRFVWREGGPAAEPAERFLASYGAPLEEGSLAEANLDSLAWLERIASSLERGFALTIDYGYSAAEMAHRPVGTLMSYRRHLADEDVLAEPGARDITAHVNFTALEQHGSAIGLERVRATSLARALLDAGERDGFAAALAAASPAEEARRRLQLKTLLFGMGETFRVLLQRKAGAP